MRLPRRFSQLAAVIPSAFLHSNINYFIKIIVTKSIIKNLHKAGRVLDQVEFDDL
jgi:replicative DNA helicase